MTVIGACVKNRIIPEIDCNLTKCNYTGGCGGDGSGSGESGGSGEITGPGGEVLTVPPIPSPPPGDGGNVTLVFNPVTGQLEWTETAPVIPDPTAPNQLFIATGAGPVEDNAQWTNPGTDGQILTINAAGELEWTDLPKYLINEEVTVTLAPNTPTTATATTLSNIDTFKLINTANNEDVTEQIEAILTDDLNIQLQASAPITIKVEMIGPPA